MAAHIFQCNLLQGLEAQPRVRMSVFNIPPTGSFPINNEYFISKTYQWGECRKQVGYVNLPWIKHQIQKNKLYQEVKQQISDTEPTYLLLYSLYQPFLEVAKRIKSKFPWVHVCVLQTDAVPGRDDMEQMMTRKAKLRGDKAVLLAKQSDSFVLLTENLTEPLEVGNRPYIVLECICDANKPLAEIAKTIPKTFLYTGAVAKVYGIEELVDAFKNIPDAQLWICGEGDARGLVEEAAAKYNNIVYFGFVPQEKIKDIQDKCAFLINPRRPSGTYTKYSFPSKTAEYMMTSKPVIMYKLEALPDSYDEYLNYLSGITSQEIAVQLQQILSLDYRLLVEKARKGREFMMENKTNVIAGQRIIQFLSSQNIEDKSRVDYKS